MCSARGQAGSNTADAAAAPVDYVAAPFLAASSALIGNARWPQATENWGEPPHLWTGTVGDSGDGKSPASDALNRDILPVIEARMARDFPDQHAEWMAAHQADEAAEAVWKEEVKHAVKDGKPARPPPLKKAGAEPRQPTLRQFDITIETVAEMLATCAPKGLLIPRDELSGWLLGLNAYNDSGRAFWIECYGGRPYRVARKKLPIPIDIQYLVSAVTGSTQPAKLAQLMNEADDGLLARFQWFWPDPVPFHIARKSQHALAAVEAMDKLRELTMGKTETGQLAPVMVPLAEPAIPMLEDFGRQMQKRKEDAGGLMRSAYGKAPGTALRLSLILEHLWWCAGTEGFQGPPEKISEKALLAAATMVSDYLMPMAERVYGDAAATELERNTTTLARWVYKTRPTEVYVRHMQLVVRLPGLNRANPIHAACDELVQAGWLRPPRRSTQEGRAKAEYIVNPELWVTQK
jgi:hypothetical protein